MNFIFSGILLGNLLNIGNFLEMTSGIPQVFSCFFFVEVYCVWNTSRDSIRNTCKEFLKKSDDSHDVYVCSRSEEFWRYVECVYVWEKGGGGVLSVRFGKELLFKDVLG